MDSIKFKKVTLEFMLKTLTDDILNNRPSIPFYWYHEDTGFHEIVECDLFRGRFITDDGDFSEFEWEIEEPRIFIKIE